MKLCSIMHAVPVRALKGKGSLAGRKTKTVHISIFSLPEQHGVAPRKPKTHTHRSAAEEQQQRGRETSTTNTRASRIVKTLRAPFGTQHVVMRRWQRREGEPEEEDAHPHRSRLVTRITFAPRSRRPLFWEMERCFFFLRR